MRGNPQRQNLIEILQALAGPRGIFHAGNRLSINKDLTATQRYASQLRTYWKVDITVAALCWN